MAAMANDPQIALILKRVKFRLSEAGIELHDDILRAVVMETLRDGAITTTTWKGGVVRRSLSRGNIAILELLVDRGPHSYNEMARSLNQTKSQIRARGLELKNMELIRCDHYNNKGHKVWVATADGANFLATRLTQP